MHRCSVMTELVGELRNVSAFKVRENVYKWEITNTARSYKLTSEAIPTESTKRVTFSLCGYLSDHPSVAKVKAISFSVQINDNEILQIVKKYVLRVSVAGYNKCNVNKFNHVKNISLTALLETKSVEIFPDTFLNFNNEQEYPESILILEANVKQIYDDLELSSESVVEDIKSMYESKEFADFKIKVQNREFLAHKFILCRSEVFRGMFRANMIETQKNEVEIEDVASEDFAELLLYMYTGNISSREKATLELADAAERFGLIKLRRFCENYVEKTMDLNNAVFIFTYADLRDRDSLKKTAVDSILENKNKFNDADLQPVLNNPNLCKMLFEHDKFNNFVSDRSFVNSSSCEKLFDNNCN